MAEIFKIQSREQIAENVYKLVLSGDCSKIERPGQFVNIALDGFFLRRPISVAWVEPGLLTLVFKVFGEGTAYLSSLEPGKELDLLTGLGNGFNANIACDAPLLVGGGVGVPPLLWLAKHLVDKGKKVQVLLGFGTERDLFFADEFRALGCEVTICTMDGCLGTKGLVTDALPALSYDYIYACGPTPMLEALRKAAGEIKGQYSFEERMGCGVGICMGCSKPSKKGNLRICREGPVITGDKLLDL